MGLNLQNIKQPELFGLHYKTYRCRKLQEITEPPKGCPQCTDSIWGLNTHLHSEKLPWPTTQEFSAIHILKSDNINRPDSVSYFYQIPILEWWLEGADLSKVITRHEVKKTLDYMLKMY